MIGDLFSARRRRWGEVDWHILLIAISLLGFGLAFLFAMSESLSSRNKDPIRFAGHVQKLVLTLPLLAAGLFLRPEWLRRNSHWIYLATILLLMAVPIIGDERNNARRWIQLPFFDLQPSELAKLGVILMLAKVLKENALQRLEDWVAPSFLLALPMGLVALQPDLGTAMTMVPVGLGMFYIAGARMKIITALVAFGALLGFVAVKGEVVHGYQLQRIETWMGSWTHEGLVAQKNRAGFHVYHARTAIGNGGLEGRGLGQGVANEAGFLPERDSASVFAVIAEESGFLGTMGLLFLYVLLVLLLMQSAAAQRDRFSRLAVGGVSLYFASHLFINTSVNLGILPMTGLTLPLFSTGGSSLMATFLALGIALGLAADHPPTFTGRGSVRGLP